MLNVLSFFYSRIWAIQPSALHSMESILDNRNGIEKFLGLEPKAWFLDDDEDEPYVTPRPKSDVQEEESYYAVIPITGSIFKRGGFFMRACGSAGTEQIAQLILSAENDDSIRGIILKIDSPGGTVDGTQNLENVIKNTTKPVVALVDDLCASAAYWFASAADQIYAMNQTDQIGSIGVLCKHVDKSGWYDANGEKITLIAADASTQKITAPDHLPLSKEDAGKLKKMLNETNNIFMSSVQSNRPQIKPESLNGELFIADQALAMGLIDGFGGMEEAQNFIESQIKKNMPNPNFNTKKAQNSAPNTKNAEGMSPSFLSELYASNNELLVKNTKIDNELQEKNKQIAKLKKQIETLKSEKLALQTQLDKTPASAQTAPPTAGAGNFTPPTEVDPDVELSKKVNAELVSTFLKN